MTALIGNALAASATSLITDSAWWYLSRASAIVAWLLLTATVVWGVLIYTRVLRPLGRPAWMVDLHQTLGTLALLAIAAHVGALLADRAFPMSPADVLVPGHSPWKPFGVALGILAMYLVVAIQVSSRLRRRLPLKAWRAVHVFSYVVWLLVALHAGLVGTDAMNRAYQVTALAVTGAVMVSASVRLLVGRRQVVAARAPNGAGNSGIPRDHRDRRATGLSSH